MTTKYVRITASLGAVKTASGAIVAKENGTAIDVKSVSSPAVTVADPGQDVNVVINGMPGDGRPAFEPLFKYVSDEYHIEANISLHLSKPLFDSIVQSDAMFLTPNLGREEALVTTDDFDGMASADDDQYVTFSKTINEMEIIFEYFGMSLSKPFDDDIVAFASEEVLAVNKGIADVMGDYVERMVFDLSTVRSDTAIATDDPSLEPGKTLASTASRYDSTWLAPELYKEETPITNTDFATLTPDIGVAENKQLDDALSAVIDKALIELNTAIDSPSIGLAKVTSDVADASDSGIIQVQDYFAEDYNLEQYVGSTYTF